MAGKIFINYRRGDDAGFTQALYQRLEDEFTAAELFMDVEGHIKPGDDFVDVLRAQVAASDVLLVVIGPRWSDVLTARQSDPDDFVAIEIKAALDQGKRVIPVLVGGAAMPRADTLPEPIRPLARRNAVGLRPERFKADCQGLVAALKESVAAAQQERAARTETERKAAEAARLEAEAQAAARARASEERGREQAAAGLSADEIRKAEELANWDFVKDRNDAQDLRDHLARFAGGTTERYALAKLDSLTWTGFRSAATVQQLRAYLDEFPKGANATAAQAQLAALEREAAEARTAEQRRAQETEEWGGVAASADVATIQAFLAKWPGGQHATAAQARIAELKRGSGAERRGMMRGAAAVAVLGLLGAGGWWGYEQWRFRETLKDASLKVLERSAQQAMKPGEIFKECDTCPVMLVVPAGSFQMGSPASEADRDSDEGPQRTVTIRHPFAIAKFEVTFEEWDACADAGACSGYKPGDSSWGRGKRPVINVNWFDATRYAEWLSAKTGQTYRLLTEAEWEYAARAGTTTRYSWGNDIGKGNANCSGCGSQWGVKQTAPVGSFRPNAFGLHDVHGNVWEWVQDCHIDYAKASNDGSAAPQTSNCSRVLRGGSWFGNPRYVRAASRSRLAPDNRDDIIGFRVARVLPPARTL